MLSTKYLIADCYWSYFASYMKHSDEIPCYENEPDKHTDLIKVLNMLVEDIDNQKSTYWLLKRDDYYVITMHVSGHDPTYGKASWSALAHFDTMHDAELAMKLLEGRTTTEASLELIGLIDFETVSGVHHPGLLFQDKGFCAIEIHENYFLKLKGDIMTKGCVRVLQR